jgi:cell division protein FtsI/penicillin-binding protein 2
MSSSAQSKFQRRAIVLATILLSIVVIVVFRLVYWQLQNPLPVPPGETLEQALMFEAERGDIYDCHGYLLAAATTVYDIGATPRNVADAALVADRLSGVLGEPRDRLLALLQQNVTHVPLKRGVSEAVKKSVMDWGVGMLQADARPGRVYPHGALAANVLGFVTDDNKGHYGLEGYFHDLLRGESGFRKEGHDPVGSLLYQFRPTRDGADLYLTLDRNIQYVVEEVLSQAVTDSGAKKGTVIVMDPTSGAILAMASFPSYDPNTRDVIDKSLFINPASSDQYEPGSVFKVITIASALDAGTILPGSTYYDSGQIVVGGRVIQNSDRKAHGETTMADLLAESLNVGAAHVSTSLGALEFYQYVRRFGFGQLTGIDLADEVSGLVRLPGDKEWHESDLGTNSFGQGIAVTPLQMLCAVSAVANHGVLMRPYFVSRIVDGDKVTEIAPREVRRVISEQAAAQTTDMMVYTVDSASVAAAVPGYEVAGKSGTSEVPVPGGYDPQETIASFVGYLPARNPRFSVLVVLDRPQKEHWGGIVAGPVFQRIAKQLVTLLGVPPTSVSAAAGVQ